MTASPVLLPVLQRVRHIKPKSGGGFTSWCPAHDDHHNSLSIDEGSDGKLLLKCFVGCDFAAIMAALDLPRPNRDTAQPPYVLSRFSLPDQSVAEHWRQDGPDGKRIWWTRNGTNGLDGYHIADMPLYHGDELAGNDTAVILCEGEKAADALRERAMACDVIAVATVCGAGATLSDASLTPLLGRVPAVWPDNDDPGREHMDRIAAWLVAHGAKPFVIDWQDAPPKGDAADWPGDWHDLWLMLLESKFWTPAPEPHRMTTSGVPEGLIIRG